VKIESIFKLVRERHILNQHLIAIRDTALRDTARRDFEMEKEKSNSPDSADVSSKKKKNKNVTTEEDTNYKSGQLIDMAKVMPRKQGYSTRHLQMTNLSLRALIYVCINFRRK